MADPYRDVFFSVSTPAGQVEVGWMFERKTRCSNIICLLCAQQRRSHFEENVKEFVRHLRADHPEAAFWLKLRNYDKMIV